MTVVSVMRSHNVARVTKSYESFGDRFTTASVDDIATSDLSQVVKGMSCDSLPYSLILSTCQALMPSCMLRPRSPIRPNLKLSSRFVLTICIMGVRSLTGKATVFRALSQVQPAFSMLLSPPA